MFTNKSKALGATLLAVVVVGGFSIASYTQEKLIQGLQDKATVVVTKVVTIIPTEIPTATPSAIIKPVVKSSLLPTK